MMISREMAVDDFFRRPDLNKFHDLKELYQTAVNYAQTCCFLEGNCDLKEELFKDKRFIKIKQHFVGIKEEKGTVTPRFDAEQAESAFRFLFAETPKVKKRKKKGINFQKLAMASMQEAVVIQAALILMPPSIKEAYSELSKKGVVFAPPGSVVMAHLVAKNFDLKNFRWVK